jgi:hypothetical protein
VRTNLHPKVIKEYRQDLENATLEFIGKNLSDWGRYLNDSSPLWNRVDWLNNRIEALGCGRPLTRNMGSWIIFQHINRALLEGVK